jgi:hypothetical protein
VLEHRLSPRLEWLTDFGVLSKDGLQKNSFSYRKTPLVGELVHALDSYLLSDSTADDVALQIAGADRSWVVRRARQIVQSPNEAFVTGYRKIRMSIGPVSIREVCFVAAMMLEPVPRISDLYRDLLQWAEREPGIRLSGGRYRREPEMVHFSEKLLQ